jgi:hypothetical protein
MFEEIKHPTKGMYCYEHEAAECPVAVLQGTEPAAEEVNIVARTCSFVSSLRTLPKQETGGILMQRLTVSRRAP